MSFEFRRHVTTSPKYALFEQQRDHENFTRCLQQMRPTAYECEFRFEDAGAAYEPRVNAVLLLSEDDVHPVVLSGRGAGRERSARAVQVYPIRAVYAGLQRMERRIIGALYLEIPDIDAESDI